MACEICDTFWPEIGSFQHWRVAVNRDQNYLGKCIVALRRHEEDFLALKEEEREELWEAAGAVRDALARSFAPNHFNYQVLGNSVRHVHMHLTPRYTAPREFAGITFTDEHWGTWPFPVDHEVPPGFLKTLAKRIAREMPFERRDEMTVYHKPSGPVKLMNSFVGRLASIGLIPGGTVRLEVKGRRSGKTRSVAVTLAEHEGQRYLVAPRGNTEWVRNVQAAGGEAILKHRKSQHVRLEEVPIDQRAPIIKVYLKKTAAVTKREFGLDPEAPLEEFEKIAERHPAFRVVPAG